MAVSGREVQPLIFWIFQSDPVLSEHENKVKIVVGRGGIIKAHVTNKGGKWYFKQ